MADKLTQREHLLYLFRINGGKVSLRTILGTELAAEYRARISEMRRDGYKITCIKGKQAGDNVYWLEMVPAKIIEDPGGQLRMAI